MQEISADRTYVETFCDDIVVDEPELHAPLDTREELAESDPIHMNSAPAANTETESPKSTFGEEPIPVKTELDSKLATKSEEHSPESEHLEFAEEPTEIVSMEQTQEPAGTDRDLPETDLMKFVEEPTGIVSMEQTEEPAVSERDLPDTDLINFAEEPTQLGSMEQSEEPPTGSDRDLPESDPINFSEQPTQVGSMKQTEEPTDSDRHLPENDPINFAEEPTQLRSLEQSEESAAYSPESNSMEFAEEPSQGGEPTQVESMGQSEVLADSIAVEPVTDPMEMTVGSETRVLVQQEALLTDSDPSETEDAQPCHSVVSCKKNIHASSTEQLDWPELKEAMDVYDLDLVKALLRECPVAMLQCTTTKDAHALLHNVRRKSYIIILMEELRASCESEAKMENIMSVGRQLGIDTEPYMSIKRRGVLPSLYAVYDKLRQLAPVTLGRDQALSTLSVACDRIEELAPASFTQHCAIRPVIDYAQGKVGFKDDRYELWRCPFLRPYAERQCLMRYGREPIPTSLTKMRHTDLAIANYNKVLRYMDQHDVAERPDFLSSLMTMLKGEPCLVDETYLQVLKQLTSNHVESSRRQGLSLLECLIIVASPSLRLSPYVKHFVVKKAGNLVSLLHLVAARSPDLWRSALKQDCVYMPLQDAAAVYEALVKLDGLHPSVSTPTIPKSKEARLMRGVGVLLLASTMLCNTLYSSSVHRPDSPHILIQSATTPVPHDVIVDDGLRYVSLDGIGEDLLKNSEQSKVSNPTFWNITVEASDEIDPPLGEETAVPDASMEAIDRLESSLGEETAAPGAPIEESGENKSPLGEETAVPDVPIEASDQVESVAGEHSEFSEAPSEVVDEVESSADMEEARALDAVIEAVDDVQSPMEREAEANNAIFTVVKEVESPADDVGFFAEQEAEAEADSPVDDFVSLVELEAAASDVMIATNDEAKSPVDEVESTLDQVESTLDQVESLAEQEAAVSDSVFGSVDEVKSPAAEVNSLVEQEVADQAEYPAEEIESIVEQEAAVSDVMIAAADEAESPVHDVEYPVDQAEVNSLVEQMVAVEPSVEEEETASDAVIEAVDVNGPKGEEDFLVSRVEYPQASDEIEM